MASSLALALHSLVVGFFLYCLLNLRSLLNRHPRPLPPGPKPWPVIGNLPHLGTKPHHSIAALAREYGPLMHLWMGSVHVVVAASASVAAQFLKTHDANFSSRPPNSGAKHIAYNYQNLVFAPYGPRWRMLRKICSVHLFSAKALDDFRHVRLEEVAILTRTLASAGKSTTVNLGQLLNRCTTNALGCVMLGRRVFSEGDVKADEFKSMVVELMEHKVGGGAQNHANLLSRLISLSLKEDADGEGGKLTDTEIKALLLAFNWELPEGKSVEKLNMDEAYGLTLQRADPLMVHPRPRLAARLYQA
ncbi:hypothetical protein RHSIM_Rhsim08G0146900 [Rhododendron simsii]|uniref:Flavonoid 3'-hydroxylase n=1 Tax=Rhododendron simsii TaxID=118357 RepID=A0A834GMS7_RHOSS|nr:hypothetical protein RHSIM_Rhsim08G0146900 [Rhododendron simsii]